LAFRDSFLDGSSVGLFNMAFQGVALGLDPLLVLASRVVFAVSGVFLIFSCLCKDLN